MWQLTSVDSGKVLRMTPFEILENNFYTGCSNGKKKKLKRKDVLGNVSGPLTLYRNEKVRQFLKAPKFGEDGNTLVGEVTCTTTTREPKVYIAVKD